MRRFLKIALAGALALSGVLLSGVSAVTASTKSDMVTVNGFEYPKEHLEALEYLNDIRAKVGVPPLELDPYLTKAAQNHADYLTINGERSHEESPDKPGFTGVTSQERAEAVGFSPYIGVTEAVSYHSLEQRYKDSISFLIKLPYHRG